VDTAFERQTRALQIPRDFAVEVSNCRVFVGGKKPLRDSQHGFVGIDFDLRAVDFLGIAHSASLDLNADRPASQILSLILKFQEGHSVCCHRCCSPSICGIQPRVTWWLL
jgi:hypothetical protein